MPEAKKPTLPEEPKFTARNVAKYVVRATVQLNVTRFAKRALIDYVGFDNDGIPVKIGAYVIGWGAADTLKPHTDKLVDKSADFVAQKWTEQKAKREEAKKAAAQNETK